MSDEVCDTVIGQCEDFIENSENHFMITTFEDNIAELDFLSGEEKRSVSGAE